MQRIVPMLVLCFFLIGCLGCGAAGGTEKEVEKAAMKEFNKYVANCGDAYFIKDRGRYYQYKKATIFVIDNTSEADRLNGIIYSASVIMKFMSAYREFSHGAWSKWTQVPEIPEGKIDPFRVVVKAEKEKGGQWVTKVMPFLADVEPITCSDVPQ